MSYIEASSWLYLWLRIYCRSTPRQYHIYRMPARKTNARESLPRSVLSFEPIPGTNIQRKGYMKHIRKRKLVTSQHVRGGSQGTQWSKKLIEHFNWWCPPRGNDEPSLLDDASDNKDEKDEMNTTSSPSKRQRQQISPNNGQSEKLDSHNAPKALVKKLQSQIKQLRKQLSRTKAKNAKLLIFKTQSKEQAKTIVRLRQQLDDAKVDWRVRAQLVQDKNRMSERVKNAHIDHHFRAKLVRNNERLSKQFENAKCDAVKRAGLVRGKKRLSDQLVKVKKQLKKKQKQLQPPGTPGPKPKPFEELTPRSKRKRARKHKMTLQVEDEAVIAIAKALSSDKDDLWVLNQMKKIGSSAMRDQLTRTKKTLEQTKMSSLECLALCSQLGISFRGVQMLANKSRAHGQGGKSIFPNRTERSAAREESIPHSGVCCRDGSRAYVNVGDLIKHTVSRLPPFWARRDGSGPPRSYTVTFKGCIDGSGDHTIWMHFIATCEFPADLDMIQLLCSSVMHLSVVDDLGNVVWENDRPGGSLYLRPVDIRHFPESAERVKELFMMLHEMDGEVLTIGADKVTAKIIVSGIDGKVRNYLLDNKTSTSCAICRRTSAKLGAGSYEEHIEAETPADFLMHGISPLHTRLRVMETIINIGCRRQLGGKWLVYGAKKKKANRDALKVLRKKIKAKLKLLDPKLNIDRQQHGRVSNVGNVARAFFRGKNLPGIADILALPLLFLRNIAKMVFAINCHKMMDVEEYMEVAKETWGKYQEMFPTYHMSPSLHMLLVHVPQLQRVLDIPVSHLTEECIEAAHKVFRRVLRRNCCTATSITALKTLMRHILIATDPQVASRYSLRPVVHGDVPGFCKDIFPCSNKDDSDPEVGLEFLDRLNPGMGIDGDDSDSDTELEFLNRLHVRRL